MERKVKLSPGQARWIPNLVDLADGFEFIDLSEAKTVRAWKDFLFEILTEMEDLGLLKSIQVNPLGNGCGRCNCPVVNIAMKGTGDRTGTGDDPDNLWDAWKSFLMDVLRELQREGLIEPVTEEVP